MNGLNGNLSVSLESLLLLLLRASADEARKAAICGFPDAAAR